MTGIRKFGLVPGVAILLLALSPFAGCTSTDCLSRIETARLLNVSKAERQTPDDVRANGAATEENAPPECFLAKLPAPAKAEQAAPVSVLVVVTDRRPMYRNYTMLSFVFLVPFARGKFQGVPAYMCGGESDQVVDYRHVVGLLIARNLRTSQGVLHARYEERPRSLDQYELQLKIELQDLRTDSTVIGYGFGPFAGIPWILGLPIGKFGVRGNGSWKLLETSSGNVVETGTFSVDSREVCGIYYSPPATAYSEDRAVGKGLTAVVGIITDGVLGALSREAASRWVALAEENAKRRQLRP